MENKLDIQSLTPADISSVYSGKDGRCCCGCAGKHFYNSKLVESASEKRGYEVTPDEVSDKMVVKVLRLIQSDEDRAEVMEGSHVALVVRNRLYVAYFSERVSAP